MNPIYTKTLNIAQYLNWIIVCTIASLSIFGGLGHLNWYLALKIGLANQVLALVVNWKLGKVQQKSWFVYDCFLIAFILAFELLTNDVFGIRELTRGDSGFVVVYLFIFISNILFLLSIFYVVSESRKLNK